MNAGKYFVYEESTLGYVRPDMPGMFNPLAGERDHQCGGFHLLEDEMADLRPATVADFDHYRVQVPPDFQDHSVRFAGSAMEPQECLPTPKEADTQHP